MPDRLPPFTKEQIGVTSVRFPSGVPMPSMTDASVDPYTKTRIPKDVQVEGIMFGPQGKGTYPGLLLLHDACGLNDQIQQMAKRLAQEGYVVLVPNLYGRQGGMVTANAEIAEALASRVKEADLTQDLTSGCEFLNTRDSVKRNLHGAVGLGLGGMLAMRLACHRKRLRAAVAFYGKLPTPPAMLKDLACPLLYHRAGGDAGISEESMETLRQAARDSGKPVDIRISEGAPRMFMDETRPETYRPDAATAAWEATVQFLNSRFE